MVALATTGREEARRGIFKQKVQMNCEKRLSQDYIRRSGQLEE